MNLNSKLFPATGGSVTLTIHFYGRTAEGTGSYSVVSNQGVNLSALTVVFPNGRDQGVVWPIIIETIVNHVLNSDIQTWYSPKIGTIEANLRSALASIVPPTFGGSLTTVVYFDGQFGSVVVA